MLIPFNPPRLPQPPSDHLQRGHGERELLVVLALFWVVSLVRVVGTVVRHEVFGAEATLALMAVLVIPWLTLRRSTQRRVRAALPSPGPASLRRL